MVAAETIASIAAAKPLAVTGMLQRQLNCHSNIASILVYAGEGVVPRMSLHIAQVAIASIIAGAAVASMHILIQRRRPVAIVMKILGHARAKFVAIQMFQELTALQFRKVILQPANHLA